LPEGELGPVATRRTAAPARAAVLPFPGRARVAAGSLAPTARSVLITLAVLLGAGLAYAVARQTSLFAITTIRVEGAPPGVAREVRDAAQRSEGENLLRLDGAALLKQLRALPDVAAVRYDRHFPHTLRLIVTPERPVAVLRQGSASWVVSMRGRVIRAVPVHTRKRLPRIWLPRSVDPTVGKLLHDRVAVRAVAALNPLVRDPLPARIANVRLDGRELTLVTASHIELRLGRPVDIPLKLAIARRLLPRVAPASGGIAYLDVSIPERTVSGVDTLKSQVKVETTGTSNAGMAH
jgi:cell division protein FtsQ